MKVWQFEALDSLFFRGAKPFNSGEGGFLDSQFPPTAQTMAGVIRSAIAEAKGVNWQAFRDGNQAHISDLIGLDSEDTGKLTFVGPYLMKDGARLYPVPLHLLYSKVEEKWGKLQPQPASEALATDQGMRRLPEVVQGGPEGAKPLEDAWLDEHSLRQILQGDVPASFFKEEKLFEYESRTGIGRDNQMRKTVDGLLYFTRHLRLKAGVRLGMGVSGADDVQPARMQRLGGEGRMAHLDAASHQQGAQLRYNKANTANTAMLVLLTHGDFDGKAEPALPEGVELVSACIGKVVREGGWDYKKRQPKPLKSLAPAGSVYFVKGDISKLGTHLGRRTAFGYGEIAIGNYEEGDKK